MDSENKKEQLINDIELEMKSNNITNSDIISIDGVQKKEIVSENGKDSFTEIKFVKTENNIDTKESSVKENPKEGYGDLTSIIQNKIKTRNSIEKNKKKNGRALSTSSFISSKEKNPKLKLNLSTLNANKSQISKNKKLKGSSSIQKKNNNNINSKTLKRPKKKNPELFVNKRNENYNLKKNFNGNLTTTRSKRVNFNEVLKRMEEERETAKKKLDNKKKELKDKEKMICTGKPKINKTKGKGNKYEKFTKDFLTRQKEAIDNLNKKKKKLIEEENKKKEKEYQKVISESILKKKMKKYRKYKSDDGWVERLYKEDPKKRQYEREVLQDALKPTFRPYLPAKKHLNMNKSMDKINQIDNVLDKYNKNQNPQFLIDYLNRNKFDESENLFRQKLFRNFVNKNKKRNNSVDINMEMSEDDD